MRLETHGRSLGYLGVHNPNPDLHGLGLLAH